MHAHSKKKSSDITVRFRCQTKHTNSTRLILHVLKRSAVCRRASCSSFNLRRNACVRCATSIRCGSKVVGCELLGEKPAILVHFQHLFRVQDFVHVYVCAGVSVFPSWISVYFSSEVCRHIPRTHPRLYLHFFLNFTNEARLISSDSKISGHRSARKQHGKW